MPDRTPADTARHEAAKQAVTLVAGVVSLLVMMPIYRRMMQEQQEAAARTMARADPVLAEIEDREQARSASLVMVRRWERVAGYLFRTGPQWAFWYAWSRAEKARCVSQ